MAVLEGAAETPWRVGRKVGRTIYACVFGPGPHLPQDMVVVSDDDVLIGVMDTPELAAEAVEAHNERLRRASADRVG